jgi:hypothetical protein
MLESVDVLERPTSRVYILRLASEIFYCFRLDANLETRSVSEMALSRRSIQAGLSWAVQHGPVVTQLGWA